MQAFKNLRFGPFRPYSPAMPTAMQAQENKQNNQLTESNALINDVVSDVQMPVIDSQVQGSVAVIVFLIEQIS